MVDEVCHFGRLQVPVIHSEIVSKLRECLNVNLEKAYIKKRKGNWRVG